MTLALGARGAVEEGFLIDASMAPLRWSDRAGFRGIRTCGDGGRADRRVPPLVADRFGQVMPLAGAGACHELAA